jgi:hypothetical protein
MHRLVGSALALALTASVPAAAQAQTDSTLPSAEAAAAGSDSDPTKPIAFSLRDEYVKLSASSSSNAIILRIDRLVLKGLGVPGPVRGVLGRVDLPVLTISTPTATETGLGDFYLQALVAPRIKGRFTIAAGTGLVLPTATADALGQGKWILAPAVVPVWFFPHKGYAYIKFQDLVSIAGDPDRVNVHYLTVTGSILRRLSPRWWALADVESNTDWELDGHTWGKAGALLGRMLSTKVGVWLKGEAAFGQYRVGEWALKTSIFLTRF